MEPLSAQWIDEIHARLLVRYGDAWIRKWRGIEPDAVKADWARVLAGYSKNPAAIAHGLEHLPDDPPTATEFARLCRGLPEPKPVMLPAPKGAPDRRREIVARVHAAFNVRGRDDRERQRQHLLAMKAAGKPLTKLQADLLRDLQEQQR